MNRLIDRVVVLSWFWRFTILVALGLLSSYLIYHKFFQLQIAIFQENENKLSQLKNQIYKYYNDQNQISVQLETFNRLDGQLKALKIGLKDFSQRVPERAILDSAIRSKINTEEIKISVQQNDEFGHYFVMNIKMAGNEQNISQFFDQLLALNELAVWQQVEFQRLEDQLSMSLVVKYYFEITDKYD